MALKSVNGRGPIRYRGPICPECGSVRSRTRATGYSEEPEEYRIRWRSCIDCKTRYTTAEVVVQDTTFYRLDPVTREKRRQVEWDKNGYTHEHYEKRVASDRLKIDVRVIRWRKEA
jgi:transcriptional regulator NrdR family protein